MAETMQEAMPPRHGWKFESKLSIPDRWSGIKEQILIPASNESSVRACTDS